MRLQTGYKHVVIPVLHPQVDPSDVEDFSQELLQAVFEATSAEGGDGDDSEGEEGCCAMCGRDMPLTRHHLIPRDVHG